MHAKLLQSCPTLYNPMDSRPPGSSVHGDSPGKNTGVDCHALFQGVFLTQGWNPCLLCLLYLQADSLQLAPPGNPYMQSSLFEMQGWMNHKLESRLPEVSTDETTLMVECEEKLKSLLMRVKRRLKKLAWNSTFKKLRSWHPVPSLHGKKRGKSGSSDRFYFSWAPESVWTVTTGMKLKDTCSLEQKLWQT